MTKVVIFDLYDTIVKGVSFDFDKGMEYLYQEFFTNVCTWEELLAYSKTFLPLYEARKENNIELSFIREELPFYFTKFGLSVPNNLEEIEFQFLTHLKDDIILDEVRETLETLSAQGIELYILSNSVFMGKTASRHLETHGVLHYFKKIYSSGDYGVRKPGKAFFDVAIDEILKQHKGLKKEDILFVGNDYIADAFGGTNAGLQTIWYNVHHQPNDKELEVWDIDDFREVIRIVLEN